MKIVVTGGGGFLGSALVRNLAGAPMAVVSIDHGRAYDVLKQSMPSGVTWVTGDIDDREVVRRSLVGADVLVHLAGVSGERRCTADPLKSIMSNVYGTHVLVEAARAAKVRQILFASSYWVYSTYLERPMPLSELDDLKTDSVYGAQKAAAERIIQSSGIASVSFRITALYGFGTGSGSQWENLIGKFLISAFSGNPLTLYGDGRQQIDFVYVEDVVRAMAHVIRNPEPAHRVFNAGGGRPVRVSEAAECFQKIYQERQGKPLEIRREPAPPGKVWPDKWLAIDTIRKSVPGFPFSTLAQGLTETIIQYEQQLATPRQAKI